MLYGVLVGKTLLPRAMWIPAAGGPGQTVIAEAVNDQLVACNGVIGSCAVILGTASHRDFSTPGVMELTRQASICPALLRYASPLSLGGGWIFARDDILCTWSISSSEMGTLD